MKTSPVGPIVQLPPTDSVSDAFTETISAETLKNRIHDSIGSDLHRVNQLLDRHFRSPHRLMGDILQHAGQFRGKQIRPMLLLLCRRIISGRTDETTRTLAAVVEMIHTATLVHDDVLDNALIRRHLPTVNRQWNTETSVLLGDYLFSRAFRLAASTGDAVSCELIGRATDLTCAGELHQIAASETRSLSERDYFRVIRGKTGQLFGLSCQLGARCAHAPTTIQRQIQMAGIELGMAFQIADDVLDLVGAEVTTGKDSGNDLANRRLTLPLLRTLRLAPSELQGEWRDLLMSKMDDHAGEEFSRLIGRITGHSALQSGIDSATETARQLIDRFLARLKLLPESDDRRLLESIGRFAIRRRA